MEGKRKKYKVVDLRYEKLEKSIKTIGFYCSPKLLISIAKYKARSLESEQEQRFCKLEKSTLGQDIN